MLNCDLHLKNESRARKGRSSQNGQEYNEADAGFHFIAFVPALGKVWKFDGLERQPQALGRISRSHATSRWHFSLANGPLGDCPEGDWVDLVKPDILTRMAEYEEDQIEFSILGLVRDPTLELIEKLAVNVKRLQAINRRTVASEAPSTDAVRIDDAILGPDPSYELTTEILDSVVISPDDAQSDQVGDGDLDALLRRRQELCNAQRELRAAVREEQQSRRADEDYAAGRRFDYGPAIRTWVRFLARKRAIETLASMDT